MNRQQIQQALNLYKQELKNRGTIKKDHALELPLISPERSLGHIYFMIDEVEGFLKQGDQESLEKAFRWLGFIQGVLWANNIHTIRELAEHNRKKKH